MDSRPRSSVVKQHRLGALDYNAPLLSLRGGVQPSPFYKLSAELSQESLRLPGAVPFQWEQVPGRRKPSIGAEMVSSSPPQTLKPSLEDLFRQNSSHTLLSASQASPCFSHSSSAVHMGVEVGTELETASDIASTIVTMTTDAFTAATAALSTMEETPASNMHVEAGSRHVGRDLILHRFLPAAHIIARDTPHTPSRRHHLNATVGTELTASGSRRPKTILSHGRIKPSHPKQHLHSSSGLDFDEEDCFSPLSNRNCSPLRTVRSIKACGILPLGFRRAVMAFFARFSLGTSKTFRSVKSRCKDCHSKLPNRWQMREKSSLAFARNQRKLADMIVQEDGDQNENLVSAYSKLQTESTPTSSVLYHAESADEEGSTYYYEANSCRFSCDNYPSSYEYKTDIINYHYSCNRARTTSPFPEGKGFLGLGKDQHDHISAPNEKPARMSTSEYCSKLIMDMDARYNSTFGSSRRSIPRSLASPNGNLSLNAMCRQEGQCSQSPIRFEKRPPVLTFSSPGSTDDHGANAQLSPRLPKSPSDSWLLKTKSPTSPSLLCAKNLQSRQASNLGEVDTKDVAEEAKWESIVKESHAKQPGHLRFSEVKQYIPSF